MASQIKLGHILTAETIFQTFEMKTELIVSVALICTFFFLGCNKKFDHKPYTETNNPTNCELCGYANSMEGQYRGNSTTTASYPTQDSLTVSLEHIFLNLGPKIDSNIMYFRRTKDFDTRPTQIDTVTINTNGGDFYPDAYPGNYINSCSMKIANDSMYIHNAVSYHIGYSILLDFKGKKLP